jgi:hypothetical protein
MQGVDFRHDPVFTGRRMMDNIRYFDFWFFHFFLPFR